MEMANPASCPDCQICLAEYVHFLYPIYCSPQHTSFQNQTIQPEIHHYYHSLPFLLATPWDWYYHHLYTQPLSDPLVNPSCSNSEPSSGSWPEGFTLRCELRWGKLERVFGASQELPDFVNVDLLQVYGTYPSTAVNITYHRGEFVVHGEPRVGEQKYRIERRLVRQTEGCHVQDKTENGKTKTKKRK